MTRREIVRLVEDEVGKRPDSFEDFLEGLESAAGLTAQHVAEAWQDRSMAAIWARLASVADSARVKARKLLSKVAW